MVLLVVYLLLVGVLVVVAWHVVSSHNMGRYFTGVLHLRAQIQYTSIRNIKQSCTLVASSGSRQTKVQVTPIKGIFIGHARHAPSLLYVLLSWQLMLKHFGLCVGLYLGLGHFSVVEFWSMQGVSAALLGDAALRLCWPYVRLTLSNIQAMLGCCCVPLRPCCADVEPTCLGTAFVACHVCHAVVQCGFVVVSWLRVVVCQ